MSVRTTWDMKWKTILSDFHPVPMEALPCNQPPETETEKDYDVTIVDP